jgi:Flp pilus assembly protein TadG
MHKNDFESAGRIGRKRKGTAVVELAVCLPVLVVMALGFIEATNAIFLQERLTSAAYEGARRVTSPGKASSDGISAATSVLTQFSIAGGTVTITPTVTTSTTTGTQVTVSVSAPLASNTFMKPFIVGNIVTNCTAKVVMVHQ